MTRRVMPAGLISGGFQRSATNSTAVALTSTIRAAGVSAFHISVETRGARMRADSTAPTGTTGVLLTTTGSPYYFDSFDGSADLKFISDTSTAGVVNIQAWKRPGDGA